MNLLELYNVHVNNYIALLKDYHTNDNLTEEDRAKYLIQMNLNCNAATMFGIGLLVNLLTLQVRNETNTDNISKQEVVSASDLGLGE